MIIATIKKLTGQELDHGKFASEAVAMAWFQPRIDQGIYGQKHVPRSESQRLVTPELKDEQGNVLQEAVYETVVQEEIPAVFVIEFTPAPADTSVQDAINVEALKFLADTDWYTIRQIEQGIPVPQEILDERQAARERIVR